MKLDEVLSSAARNGDREGVRKALADGADPKADVSLALRMASEYGHADCVRLLIPVSDLKAARAGLEESNFQDAVALLDAIIQGAS